MTRLWRRFAALASALAVIGLYGTSLVEWARYRARLTPHLVAMALAGMIVAGASMASVSSVLETWLGVYLVTGTLSLFAHMAARAVDAGRHVTTADGGEPLSR